MGAVMRCAVQKKESLNHEDREERFIIVENSIFSISCRFCSGSRLTYRFRLGFW